jgi:hypothetical protein
MELVVLYYYYPEKLRGAIPWVRELAEILVACEQFEAYNNRQRGQDYYVRSRERLSEAFAYLDKLRIEGILSAKVVDALRAVASEGAFDSLIRESRGSGLSMADRHFLKRLSRGPSA